MSSRAAQSYARHADAATSVKRIFVMENGFAVDAGSSLLTPRRKAALA